MNRLAIAVVTLVLALAGALSVPTPAAAQRVSCQQPKGTPITNPVGTPVVLVHGWAAGPGHLAPLGAAIERAHGDRVTVYAFDYASESFRWAADPAIAECLATYVHRVAQAHGRPALVVTHSMGALATRFATSSAYVPQPLTTRQISAVISIHAPNLGTPIAATPYGRLALGGGSDCLTPRTPNTPTPDGCGTPPYLPRGVHHTLIAADTTFQRTLFGRPLGSSWDAQGDGFVPLASMTTYAGSGPTPTPPQPATLVQLACRVTTDDAHATLTRTPLAPGWTRYAFLAELLRTRNADDASAGALVASTLASPCGHVAIVTEPRVQRAVTTAIGSAVRRS